MTEFKQNRFWIIYAVVLVLGVGGLGYFLYQSKNDLDAATAEYDAAVQKLQTLQTRKPFPDDQNLKQLKEIEAEYKAEVKLLAETLAKQELPIKELSPQGFQDHLREVVSDITKRAGERNVKLPENFYMGFDRYKNGLPSAQVASLLGNQLDVMATVVNKLLDQRVYEIVSLSRKEFAAETAPPAANQAAPAKPIISRYPFNIIFVSDQGKFRQIFNSIVNADQFFIIRNLTILNSQPEGPPRQEKSEIPAQSASNNTPNTNNAHPEVPQPGGSNQQQQQPSPAPNSLRVVVGQESLTVALQIEQVDFEMPEIK